MRRSRRSFSQRRIGVIDIGTNSTKLTVGSVLNDRVVTHFFARRASRLGERLAHTGRIGKAAAERTTRDVHVLATSARAHGAEVVVAVGTYSFRAARNGPAAAKRMARRAGVPIRVLTGKEEATLSYISALTRLHRPKPYTFLIDVGGGSIEFVAARHGRIVLARSLPLGALRLTDRFVHSDPISADERRAMERAIDTPIARVTTPFRRVSASQIDLVVSGGSATTALTMLAPRRRWSRADTVRVSKRQMETLADRCFALTLAQRKRLPGLPADRADIIPAGLLVLLSFLRATGKRTLLVSDGGVREGVIVMIDAELEALAHERAASGTRDVARNNPQRARKRRRTSGRTART
jgi:exopolyphosphatase/guanosine-5'-triphosphate,3'-diphosphate pyrophosphatase